MKLGARSFKTGLAVALSLLLAQFLFPESGVIAGISAVSSTQPSVARSYTFMKERLLANTIGGVLAALIAWSIGSNLLIIGLSVVILISLLNYLNLGKVISLSVVTMIVIMMSTSDNLFYTAAIRVAETFIGVVVAFLVNSFIHPPNYDDRLFHTVDYATSEFLVWLRAGLRKNTEFSIMNKDLKWARQQLGLMDKYFQLMQESHMPFRKKRMLELKQLVIYRRMLACSRSAYHVLKVLHDHENVFFSFSPDMRIMIRERLETLMSGHEQIMLKFSGRVPAEQVNFFEANKEERQLLVKRFFDHTRKEGELSDFTNQKGYGPIHLMSAILSYEDDLIHFNKLVTNYRSNVTDHGFSPMDNF